MAIVRTPQAAIDLDEIAAHLQQFDPNVAIRFLKAADVTFAMIERMPHIGQQMHSRDPRFKALRLICVRCYPKHVIVFRPIQDGVEILRVFYGRKNLQVLLDLE